MTQSEFFLCKFDSFLPEGSSLEGVKKSDAKSVELYNFEVYE